MDDSIHQRRQKVFRLLDWLFATIGAFICILVVGGFSASQFPDLWPLPGLYFIEPFLTTNTFLGILIQLIFATVLASAAFTLIALFLKSEEMISLIGAIKRKMTKSIEILSVEETEKL